MRPSSRAIPAFVAALAALAILAGAVPARAGLRYQAVTTSEGRAGRGNEMKVEGWVSGDKARVEFKESGNPMAKSGTYILTKDGGKTLYLVNPEEKTYAQWDLNAMLGMVGGIMNGMGPILKLEFSDPKFEKISEEDGGTLLGFPTRHYKFRTSYSMKMRVLGFGNASDTVTDQEVWATTKFADPGLKVWLRSEPPKTGNEQFDKLIAAEAEKQRVSGFPLKSVSTTTTTQRGKQTVTHYALEVTQLETKPVPDASFEIPAGYKETQMLPPQERRVER
jgi:uncharacterized protein DUF4412